MATSIQQNLVSKNKDYVSSFDQGGLALPPAKKYVVGEPDPQFLIHHRAKFPSSERAKVISFSNLHGRPH